MSEHSCRRLYGTHGKILASGFTKYGFIRWNRLGIVANRIFQQSKNNELLKNRQNKNGFTSKQPCKQIVTYL